MTAPFDLLVVTARDARQRWLFERRLETLPLADAARRILVVQDPPGPQPGSGGSTVFALAAALDHLEIPLAGGSGEALERALSARRIGMVHCGGFSQRLPQFASLGKTFAPVGEDETLFERVVRSLARLGGALPPGLLLACGDVLYEAPPPGELPRNVEALAWAWPAGLSQASRHGVYLWDLLTGRARETLQKPPPHLLRARGFSDSAPLDTGVLYLSPPVAAALALACAAPGELSAAGQALRRRAVWTGLDLYTDLTGALCERPSRGPGSRESPLLSALRAFRLGVLSPAAGRFVHFGTSRELLEYLRREPRASPTLINSIVEGEGIELEPGAVLQLCLVRGPVRLGRGAYALGLHAAASGFRLETGRLAYQVPLRSGVRRVQALVALGLGDDPKQERRPTLMGTPLEEWASARGLSADQLWEPGVRRSLWEARVFPAGSPFRLREGLEWLQEPDRPPPGELLSMREIHATFDAAGWWRYERRLQARVLAGRLQGRIAGGADRPLEELAAAVPSALRDPVRAELARRARSCGDGLDRARLWRLCAGLAGERDVESRYHREAFAAIRVAMGEAPAAARAWSFPPGTRVEARAPVRLDFAGGWTDTPPQALERGGCVLNAAVLLDGAMPVRAEAHLLREPVVRLIAADLDEQVTLERLGDLQARADPGDPFALHRAALLETILDGRRGRSLAHLLERAGGGVLLRTEARVPKGSGLGTSSILGAAVLACLRRLCGLPVDWRALFGAVLRLEQRMTTGGGWQDQVGGLLPGIKLTETAPGREPLPVVEPVELDEETRHALESRLVLFDSGIQRLARNVLQRVVDRYLAAEPEALSILARMPELAREMRRALASGDLESFGAGLWESWELNRRLEPTATNPEVERLLAAAAPLCLGAKLAGAGGGGYLLALARTPDDAARLRALLPRVQPVGRVQAAALARAGLELSLRTAPRDDAEVRHRVGSAREGTPPE